MALQTIDTSVGFEYDGTGTGVPVTSNATKTKEMFEELYGESGPLEDAVTAAEAAQAAAETAQTDAETAQAAAEAAQAAAEAIAVSQKTNEGVGDQIAMTVNDTPVAHTEKTSVGAALLEADDIIVVDWSEWIDSVDSTPALIHKLLLGTTVVEAITTATAAANDYLTAETRIKCTAVGATLTGEVSSRWVAKDGTVSSSGNLQKALAITASSIDGFDITVTGQSDAGHANNKSTLRTISHRIERATA